jgi:hypothetical protein
MMEGARVERANTPIPTVNQQVSWVLLVAPHPFSGFKWINGVSLSSVRVGIARLFPNVERTMCSHSNARRDGQLARCATQRDRHWSSSVQRPEFFLYVAGLWPESGTCTRMFRSVSCVKKYIGNYQFQNRSITRLCGTVKFFLLQGIKFVLKAAQSCRHEQWFLRLCRELWDEIVKAKLERFWKEAVVAI